jgi:hypothetical protein
MFFVPGPSTKKRQDMVIGSDELHCQPHSIDPAGNVADKNIIELEGKNVSVEGCASRERNTASESGTVGEVECFGQNSDVNCEKSGEHSIQQRDVKDLLQSGSSLVTKSQNWARNAIIRKQLAPTDIRGNVIIMVENTCTVKQGVQYLREKECLTWWGSVKQRKHILQI